MNLWPVFVFVIVASSFIINFVIAAFVGAHGGGGGVFTMYFIGGKIPSFYPPWLFELHLAFFWYSAIYGSLKRKFCDVTRGSNLWEMASLIPKLLLPYLGISLLARFALDQSILVAYGVTWFLCVFLPMYIAIYLYPRKQAKLEEERIAPEKIQNIAEQHPLAQRFFSHYPEKRVDIIDNQRKKNVAICVFSHRISRPERAEMQEDLVLEIPVDLKARIPLEEQGNISRYIFYTNENRSAVIELDDKRILTLDERKKSLDEFTLSRYDTAFERFPSLLDNPLPVAVRR